MKSIAADYYNIGVISPRYNHIHENSSLPYNLCSGSAHCNGCTSCVRGLRVCVRARAQTVSEVVDRITKAKMKQVAEQGLDPRQHVPLLVKVMKGGLKIVQELQMSWQNSETGESMS